MYLALASEIFYTAASQIFRIFLIEIFCEFVQKIRNTTRSLGYATSLAQAFACARKDEQVQ